MRESVSQQAQQVVLGLAPILRTDLVILMLLAGCTLPIVAYLILGERESRVGTPPLELGPEKSLLACQEAADPNNKPLKHVAYLGFFPDLRKVSVPAEQEVSDMIRDKELYHQLQNLENHPGMSAAPELAPPGGQIDCCSCP